MKEGKVFCVYILTNYKNTVFYIGVTSDLRKRVYQHKRGLGLGFSKKYHLKKLVYYEFTTSSYESISREKQLKNWQRSWKVNLIKQFNPYFLDLSDKL